MKNACEGENIMKSKEESGERNKKDRGAEARDGSDHSEKKAIRKNKAGSMF
jgi:hypothetical protein